MKTLTLQRIYRDKDCTLGVLYDESYQPFLVTLEEPWKDNQKGISCIPDGLYTCKHHDGFKFKDVWEVTNVPGRGAILIHTGNSVADISGCLLVGTRHGNIGEKKAVLNSKNALQELKAYIMKDAQGKNNSFMLNVISI